MKGVSAEGKERLVEPQTPARLGGGPGSPKKRRGETRKKDWRWGPEDNGATGGGREAQVEGIMTRKA